METRIKGKVPWKIDKMTPEVYQKMERQIVPIAMDVTDITSTWKLSQNKPSEVRERARLGIASQPMGADVARILQSMAAANI